MREPDDFLKSLNDGREIYYRGKRVDSVLAHPTLRVTAMHAAKLYQVARSSYDEGLQRDISMYFKIPSNSQDLMQRHKLVYDTTMACNGVFNISQAIGSDALFSLLIMSRKIDDKYKTKYAEKVERYYRNVASKDLTIAVAQTDVKGDRRRRPHEQVDPDMYLRVLEVRDDGIIVNGAKAHTTQSAVSDEIIVIPTRAMTENDKDYSVAFAVPVNTSGLKLVVRPIEELEGNTMSLLSRRDYECETLTIFDRVHVPWERVFLFREHEFAGPLANMFATFHRFTAISYRAATSNLYLGATSLVSKANGIFDAPHLRDKFLGIVMYKEIMKMCAIAAAYTHLSDEGIAMPNPLYTNVGKLYSNQNFTHVLEGLVDAAGGIVATLPSNEDLQNEYESGYIFKYLRGAIEGKARTQVLKIVKELVGSSLAGYMMALMVHAEGSMEASKLAMLRDYDLSESERLVEGILTEG